MVISELADVTYDNLVAVTCLQRTDSFRIDCKPTHEIDDRRDFLFRDKIAHDI